ncbi:extracellular matrix regulator RemB [Ruminococcus sp.]|uniref:extracellular matrix regulator RemB n=1 Tax=Ruminococcus sp. TaxID=41978 RepID=UPI00388F8424
MKYLHLGKETSIEIGNIVGIFDLDTTTVSKHTRSFLKTCEDENRIVNVSYELPKSFILYDFGGEYSIYLSPLNAATLLKRMTEAS